MTGLTDTEHIIKGLEAGGVDYITKPIVPGEVLARIRVHLANARMAHSARTALDTFGRFLLAASRAGRVLWYTPQAAKLLGLAFADFDREGYVLPAKYRHGCSQCARRRRSGAATAIEFNDRTLRERDAARSTSGRSAPTSICCAWWKAISTTTAPVLKQKLAVTEREAEVLLWIARGKSNRDIAEILDLSPRTVNKHLEQIYAKLGVENRTSAAALAVRTIGVR